MTKQEERIDELERGHERLATKAEAAAESLRDQKGTNDKLLTAIGKLGEDGADTKSSIRWIQYIIGALVIPTVISCLLQWSVYTKLGQLDERSSHQAKQVEEVLADISKIKEQKGADTKAIADAASTLKTAVADFEKSQAQAHEIEKALRGPEIVIYLTLAKEFAVDPSVGDAVLFWDTEYADIFPGKHAEEAAVIHLSSPTPAEAIPGGTFSVKIMDRRKLRVQMAMNSQEDKAKIEDFFKRGGIMSLDIAVYLAAK